MIENNETLNIIEEAKDTWQTTLENERNIVPFVDIYENDNEFVLTANMPGVAKEDVHVKLEEGSLYIFGKVDYKQNLEKKYILNENNFGNYYRKFNLSDSIDDTKINATYENGQAIVTLPKHDRVKPRTISVK